MYIGIIGQVKKIEILGYFWSRPPPTSKFRYNKYPGVKRSKSTINILASGRSKSTGTELEKESQKT